MRTVSVAVLGAGNIGRYHAESVATRIRGARLAVVADPAADAAARLAGDLSCAHTADPLAPLSDASIDAVLIATPGPTHADLIAKAAAAGKAVFCEKPIAWDMESADAALAAVAKSGVLLQIGFQRRFDPAFARARELVASGQLGAVQLMRSITRDPKLTHPERVPPWAIFRETLIHDFDVLSWMAGCEPVEVFAMADALVAPGAKATGLRDTATVQIRFESGALAVADASFQAVYGYDVRAEVFGSAGMAIAEPRMGSGAVHYAADDERRDRVFWYLDLFGAAYTAEVAAFVSAVRAGAESPVTGDEARRALAIALAAIRSVEERRPVAIGARDAKAAVR
jgi:myo-inositol 2-dehydrogenase/D-chiro-inositol 1-dehydrogenase